MGGGGIRAYLIPERGELYSAERFYPINSQRLQQAALSAIAALSLWNNDIRREVAENHPLITIIRASLSHPHTGVRFAACQCVRALSRLVAVVRTSLVDSGLGMKVYGVFLNKTEDRRVMFAASSVICNLVNDFSPLRPVSGSSGSSFSRSLIPTGYVRTRSNRTAGRPHEV